MTNPDELNAQQIALDTIREFFNRPATPGGELWKLQTLTATRLLSTRTDSHFDLIDAADLLQKIDNEAGDGGRPVTGLR